MPPNNNDDSRANKHNSVHIRFKDYNIRIDEGVNHYLVEVFKGSEVLALLPINKDEYRGDIEFYFRKLGLPEELKDLLTSIIESKFRPNVSETKISDAEQKIKTVNESLTQQVQQEVSLKVDVKTLPLFDKVKYLCENLWNLIPEKLGTSQEDFKKSRIEEKVAMIYRLLSEFFEFVRVLPRSPQYESVTYVVDDYVLWDPRKEVLEPVIGALVSLGLARKSLISELEVAITSTGNLVPYYMVDPWDYLKLRSYILDLNELRLLSTSNYYFRYNKLDVKISQQELDEIRSGSYDIEKNKVYTLWRNRFDDTNWGFFIDSVGTWLAPMRFKHVGYLVGPTNVGKTSLLAALTNPIEPVVAHVSPRTLTSDYPFALMGLIGKQINVYSEKIIPTLKNITVLNNIVGESDFIEVQVKKKAPMTIRSLKSMMFAMTGLPMVSEYNGEELKAFAERLSIILCEYPEEGFMIKKEVYKEVSKEEAFKFLLWCRVQLERRNWEIRRLSTDEILERLLKSSNTAIKFIEESGYVEKDPTASVKAMDLYKVYEKWCEEVHLIPMSRNDFYAVLDGMFVNYKGEGVKRYKGVRVKWSVLQPEEKTLFD